MFTTLYELILGQNNDPIYRDEIFTPVGTITFFVALLLAAVFYAGLGRWKAVFHRGIHWFIALAIMLVFAYGYAVGYALDRTGEAGTDSYMNGFGAVNALYAGLEFFIFSLLLKRFSIFARRTPF